MVTYKLCFSILFVSVLSQSEADQISPDNKKLYHDITAGRGLYSQFNKIFTLNESNFRQNVFNNSNSNAWLVEFYNSWCGHCHRFAPIWKQFALDIYGWKDVIKIGAVDCSNSPNTPLCRDFEVMYYPMVKYFPPFPASDFLGTPMQIGSVDNLVKKTLKILRQEALENSVNQPTLLPFTGKSTSEMWNHVGNEIEYIITIIQDNDTFLGDALALDFLHIPQIKLNIVYNNNSHIVNELVPSKYPSIYLINRNNNISPIVASEDSRLSVYTELRVKLSSRGVGIPEMTREIVPSDVVIDLSHVMAVMDVEAQIKKKLNLHNLSDMVFQVDLEGAIRQSLKVEIPRYKSISNDALKALKLYLQTLVEFFPFGKKGKSYLNSTFIDIKDKQILSGSEFMEIVTANEQKFEPYLSPNSGWLGCRGSHPKYRGYPCSLWTLFHTLTVHADLAREADGKKVLRAMLGYIKYFFGCTDCSQHFQKMAVTFEGNVTSTDDAILWLWRAHNNVNKRLKSDPTEDARHPKVQFPPPNICQACHSNNGHWKEQVVLPFLKKMYQDISYFRVDDLSEPSTTEKPILSNALKNEHIVDEKSFNYSHAENKQLIFHFNLFDVSLFVVLYVVSMGIIIVVCAKFLLKKSYRKKAYAYDIFQKV